MEIEKIIRVEPEPMERTRRKKSRIFVWDANQSIQEQVTGRNARPIEDFAELIPEAIKAAGLHGVKNVSYSPKACTCGCTPGFMADGWLLDDLGRKYDLHITTKKHVNREPKVVTSAESVQDAAPNVLPLREERSFSGSANDRADREERRGRRRETQPEAQPLAARQASKTARTPREQMRNRRGRNEVTVTR